MDSKRRIYLLFIIIILIVIIGVGVFLSMNLRKNSGLQIDSLPKAKVLLNGKELGTTPFYQEGLAAGDYKLKLVATSSDPTNMVYETNIKLVPGALTMVSRVFDNSAEFTSGQIDYLSPTSSRGSASIIVLSDPTEALVKIDGEDKGLTPLNLKDLRAGSHEIVVVKPGFNPQPINGELSVGFELNIFVKLSKAKDAGRTIENPAATKSAQVATPAASLKMVTIKETGTGFLRVREKPSLSSSEIGRVNVGDKLELLEEGKGWVRIKFGTSSGWVNQTYVTFQ